ncbi:MAG TPA: hypothetical protein VGL15_11825 [Vicinamibacteria bacterium]
MKVLQEEYEHPTQASRVRLNVFELPPGPNAPGVDTPTEKGGYLVTEERIGTVTVVSTLGFFDPREAAMERLKERARQLQLQQYRPVASAA